MKALIKVTPPARAGAKLSMRLGHRSHTDPFEALKSPSQNQRVICTMRRTLAARGGGVESQEAKKMGKRKPRCVNTRASDNVVTFPTKEISHMANATAAAANVQEKPQPWNKALERLQVTLGCLQTQLQRAISDGEAEADDFWIWREIVIQAEHEIRSITSGRAA